MKVYKVGGAVRDKILGIKPIDNDWIVVGSSPEEMVSSGFKPIGKDFPVFLHPETNEEYALQELRKRMVMVIKVLIFTLAKMFLWKRTYLEEILQSMLLLKIKMEY